MKTNSKTLARAQSIVDAINANVDAYMDRRVGYEEFCARQRDLYESVLSPTQKARKARGEHAVCLVGDRNQLQDAVYAILQGQFARA